MSKISQLNSWWRKNRIIMMRHCCGTICEIIFPVILMLIVVLVRKAFKIEKYSYGTTNDAEYISTNSTSHPKENDFYSLTKHNALSICNTRPTIAIIGNSFPNEILDEINKWIVDENDKIKFKRFNAPTELNEYISGDYYMSDEEQYPEICFGVYFEYRNNKYDVSLHYFGGRWDKNIQDIPSTLLPNWDPFQNGPDMDSYVRYVDSGYFELMSIIYNYILQNETGNSSAAVSFGIVAQKFEEYQEDTFGRFIGFIIPFFLVIAYLFPLSQYVSKMVLEKETRSKEGMKIMGWGEGIYFLSYFIQYSVINTIHAFLNGIIICQVFDRAEYIYIFAFFWMYGMNVFALCFFFQAFMDKTRLAMIVSVWLYFIMYFVSIAVISEEVSNTVKMVLSILPPTALQLGINVIAQFNCNGLVFGKGSLSMQYNHYSAGDMYIMFAADFFIYWFWGYYFQNIISHEFGISRPFYFLCTRKYWGCSSKKALEALENPQNMQVNNKKSIDKDKDNDNPNDKSSHISENNNINIHNNINIEPNYVRVNNSKNQAVQDKDQDQASNDSHTQHNQIQVNERPQQFFQSEDLYKDKTKIDDVWKIQNLRKVFDDGKLALDGVSFNWYKNEIFALLGHNGAGKSTLISILSGLYEATSGHAYYEGKNIFSDTQMDVFRSKLSICPQHDVWFEEWTVKEHLSMFCVFKGFTGENVDDEITKTLTEFKMWDVADIIVKNLAAGWRRKLSIAIALIGGSKIIFLDEPSSGMDITSRRNLWEILKQCGRDKIIVLTTHYMEEAAVWGKRIGIISNGNMKCIGTPWFLIENFGKFISINITKESDANNEKIIDFFTSRVENVEYEVWSEEILFRLPKNTESHGQIKIGKFFEDWDLNVNDLGIKSYGASMPTLEDVFLNVSSMERNNSKMMNKKISDLNIEHDNILFNDENYNMRYTSYQKFKMDLSVSLKKRFFQIIRDSKSFLLEVLCPIILVLIGVAVSSVEFFRENPSFELKLDEITKRQTIYYTAIINQIVSESLIPQYSGVTYTALSLDENNSVDENILSYLNTVYNKEIEEQKPSYVSYYFIKWDKTENKYEFVSYVNLEARQGSVVYTNFMLHNIINYAKGENVDITFTNWPMPSTRKEKNDGQERNNSTWVFFIAVAFALIPANFVTLIIKEREKNTKHLQIISGISLLSYWLSNFIFELVKYYFTGGVCLLIVYLFDFYTTYFYVLYLLYGPAMVSFTYLFSFVFVNESTAQNAVILLNFLFGALGGSVILILRIMEDLTDIGKGLAYIFRIIPSFCFCYGFNELLSANSLLYIDDPKNWMKKPESTLMEINYIGSDCLFWGLETVIYIVWWVVFEINHSFSCCSGKENTDDLNNESNVELINNPSNLQLNQNNNINDSQVMKEIDKANENEEGKTGKYSIKVQSWYKNYYKPNESCCGTEQVRALKGISFCWEYGTCFGLLGINGAGKTTTFKLLTNEIIASKGNIFINNKEICENFHEVRSLIGYCPQFDSFFEYMTVFENLEFYAKIKGVKQDKLKQVIISLMAEMNLSQYKDKISGRLSGGNKRKLSVSIAMICNPPIVLLDEPSTGMDPEARRFMWSVIHKISTRKKKCSVIMTTHSMDEAETLCRRIGIMVNGQFKCMGSSNSIKEKYGEGYEINLQITPLKERKILEMYVNLFGKSEQNITVKDIHAIEIDINTWESTWNQMHRHNYVRELQPGRLGDKLLKEIRAWNRISIVKIISWCYYVKSALRIIKLVKNYFSTISISDYVDNSFVFKIHKTNDIRERSKSIGFLFGWIEKNRNEANVSEYSIAQTSLEQIFNKFASSSNYYKSNKEEQQKAIEVIVDDVLLNNWL